jgi:phosphopantothenoylcysteine synthetase/decarboxylase
LSRRRYDIIFHAAAVSDFLPARRRGKIPSGRDIVELRLRRAPKLVTIIRRLAPKACLVIFKLECGVTDAVLKARALAACRRAGADYVVANTFRAGRYHAFVLDRKGVQGRCATKPKLVSLLFDQFDKMLL